MPRYYMLHKPAGCITARRDARHATVMDLFPEEDRDLLFPVGRLDRDTEGLLVVTDDGPLAFRLLSPKTGVEKTYFFCLKKPITQEEIETLEAGVDIGDVVTKPCRVVMQSETEGEITLIEGKYHQIKRMAEAVGNKIVFLERITFAGIELDRTLKRGQWRYLNEEEMLLIKPYLS